MAHFIKSLAKPGGTCGTFEAQHRFDALFDPAMVLLATIVEVTISSMQNLATQHLFELGQKKQTPNLLGSSKIGLRKAEGVCLMPGRVFSREFKLTLVKAIASGEKTNTQVCREHHIDQSVLTRWKREYRDRGDAAFTPSAQDRAEGEVEVLQAKIAELEGFIGKPSYEISVLKKVLHKFPLKDGAK